MMTNEQYLLGKLAEEAAELAQIAIKAQQFGLEEVFGGEGNPDGLSNRDRIENEFNDVVGVVHLLNRQSNADITPDVKKTTAKIEKVLKWREYAVSLGLVQKY